MRNEPVDLRTHFATVMRRVWPVQPKKISIRKEQAARSLMSKLKIRRYRALCVSHIKILLAGSIWFCNGHGTSLALLFSDRSYAASDMLCSMAVVSAFHIYRFI